ncbi:barstar family protein [Streptomyces decoyicus]|uniref:barstar family protein n=1 Tax=Streptomyces decoyicus TaxID=249567 RepID=UPI00345CB475
MKYLLVRENDEGEDELWGRCANVEGLFVDPVPPPREVLTFRGCTPAGPLREAVSRPGETTALLGNGYVEVSDDTQMDWWELLDAVVLAHHPSRSDPSLVDVVVGAGVNGAGCGGFTRSGPARFELFLGNNISAGQCLRVDGLLAPRQAPAEIPMELIGCEPTERLLSALRRPHKWERDWAELWALDRTGQVMAHPAVGLGIDGARPSVLGGTLIDITLTDGGDDRPSPAARPVWESWYQGVPTLPNQWAPYSSQGRSAWLGLALHARRPRRPDRSGGVHHLDGRFVTDVPGLHCAMSEALAGPGGYFGWGMDAFRDCLCGGFGLTAPFTVIWHDADVARRAPADAVSASASASAPTAEGLLSYVEEIVRVLEGAGVTVILA